MVEAELTRAHGRDHPLFEYWMRSTRTAVAHQKSLIEAAGVVAGLDLRGKDALDLGCGTGAACVALAQSGARNIYGVDLRLGGLGLRMARVRLTEEGVAGQFIAADAGRLALTDECVDFCFCDQVVEHVSDSQMVIAEIWRVLRPGGVAYIGAPNRLSPVEAHTGLWFAHWLPYRKCERYVKWRGRRAQDDLWDVRTRTWWTIKHQLCRQGFVVVGSLTDFLPVWRRRWQGPKHTLAGIYGLLATRLHLPLDPLAPIIALAVVKPGPDSQ
jgi:ubiquinone/menaquinone biosynthesis C-methylase UbiE